MYGFDDILRAVLADLHIVAAIMAAIYLLAFVCAVREIMNSRTSQGSIAWLLSLGLLPFPTAFLYLIFGWKFFDDYATDRIRNGRAARPLRAKDLALIDQETSAALAGADQGFRSAVPQRQRCRTADRRQGDVRLDL